MNEYVVIKKTKAYHLVGRGVKNHRLISTEGIFLQKDGRFNGLLVFLRMSDGFKPMVKVLDRKLKQNVYYFPRDVKKIDTFSNTIGDNYYRREHLFMEADMYPNLNHYGYTSANKASELVNYQQSYPQYSNASGDFFKNLFSKVNQTVEDKDLQEAIKNQKEISEEDVKSLHKNSGSKLSFGDWISSDSGVDTVNNLSALAFSLMNKGNINAQNQENNVDKVDEDQDDKNSGFRILNMHPITFGIVTIGTLAVGILIIGAINKNKK